MSPNPLSPADWNAVKTHLRTQIGDAPFASWIEPLDVASVEEGVVRLQAPTRFFRDRVEIDFGEKIKAAWLAVKPDVRRVDYTVGVRQAAEPGVQALNEAAASGGAARKTSGESAPGQPRELRRGVEELKSISLNDRMRFESFVVGRPNEFAYAAAKQLCEADVTPFNPLFLYGQSGLGKTHLLHAIAWSRQELKPDEKILFISAETFLFEFVSAVRHQTTFAFKEVLRSVDMLIIDDVQHIIGKNYTQEEFFHTFNALADQHRQIVLSADCSPTDMDGLDERLRSRLGWGLVADLHPTDYELRLGILESKTEQAKRTTPDLDVDPKVLDFLAQRISVDVRTLEGALNRLFAYASMLKRPATVEMAQRELRDLLRHTDRKISVEEIQRKVAEHYNIRLADMYSPRRARAVARPRQIAMYLCKQLTQKSLPDIGQKFGGRDHTTVLHAVRRVAELRQIDSAFDDDVERLRRSLEG